MAMKIDGEYLSDKVTPKNFEQLAEEAGLAKPIVRNRVPKLAEGLLRISTKQELNTRLPKRWSR